VLGVVPGAAIYLMGQAPGPREREVGRPFAWTAGTTLFRWFASIGADEARFRERVYMAAVIRCFPGKLAGKTGDRKPAPAEVENCRPHAGAELTLLRPRLVLAVGRLAIEQFVPCPRLEDVVGQVFPLERGAHAFDLIPLPHPSGLSRWPKVEPGKSLLPLALERVGAHPAWRDTFGPA
jgi:uracil-DNA glycosylase